MVLTVDAGVEIPVQEAPVQGWVMKLLDDGRHYHAEITTYSLKGIGLQVGRGR